MSEGNKSINEKEEDGKRGYNDLAGFRGVG